MSFSDLKYRHDFVRHLLFDIFWWARVFVKKETFVNFLTDRQKGRSTFIPIDGMVCGWVGEKHACV